MNELKAFFENVGNISFSVYKWISKIDWKEINNIIDFIANKFPVEYEKLLLSLMDRGWLIWVGKNDSLTYFNNMFDCLVNKDVSEQDNYMKIFTKNIQESLIEMLLLMHPQRSQQIKDSFEAHNNNLYYASIPSLIALSEGVCRDYFPQIGLFKKQMNKRLNKSEPETINMFKNVTFLDIFEEIYLKPLKVKSKITETITKKPTTLEEQFFNRHLIMHGVSTKYGTELNSYKAICLLYYIQNAMKYIIKIKTNTAPKG